ncbi:MAG: hypothetical protein ACC655_01745 [Rhodothermia bacterium]
MTLFAVLATLAAQPIKADTEDIDAEANSRNVPFARLKIEGFDGTRYVRPQRQGFSASEILDVVFKARLSRCTKGEYLLELKLYTPNGHLYQILSVPVTIDTGSKKQSVMVKGYPKPVEQQSIETDAEQGKKRNFVTTSLPVAGTFITTNSLYGEWKIEAFLDGKPLRLVGKRRFTIRP